MTAPLRHVHADAVLLDRRGRRSAETLAAISERDQLLRQAARFYPGCSQRETARQLHIALARYRDGRWRRERTEALCPPHHAGKLTALLWMTLKVRDVIPPGAESIRKVLAR